MLLSSLLLQITKTGATNQHTPHLSGNICAWNGTTDSPGPLPFMLRGQV